MRNVTAAAIQMSYVTMIDRVRVSTLIRKACEHGVRVILLPELFSLPYFCKEKDQLGFQFAKPLKHNPLIDDLREIGRRYSVVLGFSVFERTQDHKYFNTLVLIDADGTIAGIYRKSHIPEGPGYEEKFFFHPGDTGFPVFVTRYGRIGCGLCWDQWFPEVARILTLRGAEIILYPSAIGSEPTEETYDSCPHWCRVIQGHAAANMVPIVVTNRIGTEHGKEYTVTFYGSSFITDSTGEIVSQASRYDEEVIYATFDLESIAARRKAWGLLQDRRPDLYGPLIEKSNPEIY